MRKKTTVELPEVLQDIADHYQAVYGLRNVIAAGILLFDKLAPELREKIVEVANGLQPDNNGANLSDEAVQSFTYWHILTAPEQKVLNELRQNLGPDQLVQILQMTAAGLTDEGDASRQTKGPQHKQHRPRPAKGA